MATTIKSTALDFNAIKNNLKTFLAQKEEFSDYNFEASGISNLLDVLAYNTHYNALIANFALNESYIVTAQLRNSLVSLAESLGYIPDSKTSSSAAVRLVANLSNSSGRNNRYTIPVGFRFSTTVDDITYTFQTREALSATDNGSGIYEFRPLANPENEVILYEGIQRTKLFNVGANFQEAIYVIPDEDIDTSTAIIKVFNSPGGQSFQAYTNLLKATRIDQNSTLYVLRESPNKYFELTFGNGTSLGTTPIPGNQISVDYLRSSGAAADGAKVFNQATTLNLQNVGEVTLDITTISPSAGGGEKESSESIRKNAPFQYAAQNRMVTALDYSALILKNFSTFIDDIKTFGGEDALVPEYGTVFVSIVFKPDLPSSTIVEVKKQIRELADQLSVVSFDLKFTDPETTYISTEVNFQFNPSLTGLSESQVIANVENSISTYFEENTGKFDQVFRRSAMLATIDDTDAAVLSSRSKVVMQKRVFPVLTATKSYSLRFPTSIETPTTTQFSVFSSVFTFNNTTVRIRNNIAKRTLNEDRSSDGNKVFEIAPSTELQLVTAGGKVIQNNIGEYNSINGTITISNLTVQSIIGGLDYIKMFAIPANQSVIDVSLNDIIARDEDASFSRPVIVETR